MKSALFVDFDNVFSSLRRLDPVAAERFALQPNLWMHWLAETLQLPLHSLEDSGRRVLVRRCYLNPQAYQRFRPAFNRAGFEIVDCPPMTSEGKTSTDIHMVLDIVDLLQHQVHYDEFIVFSADADFTPVLRKLRRWDRRTTVLAVGFPSAAYQASADLLIDQDEFIRAGLGLGGNEPEPAMEVVSAQVSRPTADVVREVGEFVRRLVKDSSREVALSSLASKAAQEVDGLSAADWAGFGSFRKLLEALSLSPLVVDWDTGTIRDPARHSSSAQPKPSQSDEAASMKTLLNDVSALVQEEVQKAERPVSCARLAQLIVAKHQRLATDWGGKGSFRKFMDALDVGRLKIEWANGGGIVSDPLVLPAQQGNTAHDWGNAQHLLPLIQQIHTATGMPLMSPSEIQGLFDALATDVAQTPFGLSDTGKRVRDRCKEAGLGVSRADVSYVLKGILLAGHDFGKGNDEKAAFARSFIESMRVICAREQFEIDEIMMRALLEWASGSA